jgi:hypothetical protein
MYNCTHLALAVFSSLLLLDQAAQGPLLLLLSCHAAASPHSLLQALQADPLLQHPQLLLLPLRLHQNDLLAVQCRQ